jgi:methylated-DNA-[protein]-cysteine S-methyltransferase
MTPKSAGASRASRSPVSARGFALFDTVIGRSAIAWGNGGITCVRLPEGRDSMTRARLRRRFPDAEETPPPENVARAIEDISALLRGKPATLDGIVLDMAEVPPFHRRVYEAARKIPPGKTLSYGEIATRLGAPGSARAVGQALGKNPFAIVVPCHRVLAAGGKVGGFSANGGVATKLRMLGIEKAGASAATAASVAFGDGAYGFDPAVALEHLRAKDARLRRLIDEVGPFSMAMKGTRSIFGALAEAIVYQQLHGKAAATIYARLSALFDDAREGPTAARLLRLPDAALRGAGLSQNKMLSLQDLARKELAGELPALATIRELDDDGIVERLTEVRGIGRWTVEMLLMVRLGRPDVLPVDDYGIRKGFALTFGTGELADKKVIAKRAERWRPYRTVASWYLWRAVELPRHAARPKTRASRSEVKRAQRR